MTEVNELSFSRGGGMAEGEGGGGIGRIIKIAVIALVLLLLIGGGGYAAFWFLTSGGDEEEGVLGPTERGLSGGPKGVLSPKSPFFLRPLLESAALLA